tara:strand:- start:824 stop:1168 length:345 start_codon:yes stop_codon:yes gene_type:complete
MTTRTRKQKIKVMGKDYKVAPAVAKTMESLAQALHSHEVALLTWLHKEYTGVKLTKDELETFRSSLRDYCMQIPDSESILKRMKEVDAQIKEDIKNKNKEKDQNKDGKAEGVKE